MDYSSNESTPKSWRAESTLTTPQMSPYSIHPPEIQNHDEVLSTTVLADNIHCGSCVKHIEDTLTVLGSDILHVSVSVVSHEAHILHQSSIGPSSIYNVLEDGGFEVSSATTVDVNDKVRFEFAPSEARGEYTDAWRRAFPPLDYSDPISHCLPLTTKSKKRRHVENCTLCQEQEMQDSPGQRSQSVSTRVDGRQGSGTRIDQTEVQSQPLPPLDTTAKAVAENIIIQKTGQFQSRSEHLGPRSDRRESDDSSVNHHTIGLSIDGMASTSCVNAIKERLKSMDEVKAVSIDLTSKRARVDYDGRKGFAYRLVEIVENLGYHSSFVEETTTHHAHARNENSNQPNLLHEAMLSIGGMTCAVCSNAIIGGLQELSMVKDVNVSLMTNSAKVKYEGQGNLESIVEKIEDLGYECSTISTGVVESGEELSLLRHAKSRTLQLRVEGMFCEKCPTRIRQALEDRFGTSVQVQKGFDLRTPIATISYEPQLPTISIRTILNLIDSLNRDFHTSVYQPPSIEGRSQQVQLKELKKISYRLFFSALAAIPTLLIGIIWMSLVSGDNPIRKYFEAEMWAGNVTRADWALFMLATPVYFFAASVFHVRALKEIRALWRRSSKVSILRRFYRFGSMNLLISAGTTVAYVSSLALLIINATSVSSGASSTYFDSVVFLTFFILAGRYMEALGKSKAGDAVALLGKLRPQQAMLIDPLDERSRVESGSKKDKGRDAPQAQTNIRRIDSDLLEIGDTVIIAHGSSPPADGILVSDDGQFDESSLTGESRPVKKIRDDRIFAGTINIGNPVRMEVIEVGGSSMLDQIVAIVREGQSKRAPVERLADVVTGYFVPVITALAIITFFVWFALGQTGALDPKYLGNVTGGWAFWSLEFAIAVFVVACPCAIGLAAPTALFVGGGLAAKHGILVRGGGEAFQEAGDLDAIVFDKTGTLTEGGDLKVTDYEILSEDRSEEQIWSIVAALEEASSHPIARAILDFASSKQRSTSSVQDIIEVPGRGLRGTFAFAPPSNVSPSLDTSYEAALGSEALITSMSPSLLQTNTFAAQTLSTWKSQAKSVAVLAMRRLPPSSTPATPIVPPKPSETQDTDTPWQLIALLSTSDSPRPSSLPTILALRERGIEVYMLSGDNPQTATAVGTSLGIPLANIFADVLPTEKAEKIRHLRQTLVPKSPLRRRRRLEAAATRIGSANGAAGTRVAFVGDGTNDAPALLAASVSISLSTGSPIAMTSSSFILMSSDLRTIIKLLDLSRRVFRRIKFNFCWALGYNVLLVPIAAG
ncbi:MAG: hypothetical protein LQ340_004554, partial [Diploschistes diacapsis]